MKVSNAMILMNQVPRIPHRLLYPIGLLALTYLGVMSPAFADEYLVKNPGFEEASSEGLDHWIFYVSGQDSGGEESALQSSYHQDSEHVKSGDYSLHIVSGGPSFTGVYQNVRDLEPGAEYTLSVWARTEMENQKVSMALFSPQTGQQDGGRRSHRSLRQSKQLDLEPSGEWQEFSTTFTVPTENAETIRVDLRSIPDAIGGVPAEVWFDDVVLKKTSP
jgi:hypothetical protein